MKCDGVPQRGFLTPFFRFDTVRQVRDAAALAEEQAERVTADNAPATTCDDTDGIGDGNGTAMGTAQRQHIQPTESTRVTEQHD